MLHADVSGNPCTASVQYYAYESAKWGVVMGGNNDQLSTNVIHQTVRPYGLEGTTMAAAQTVQQKLDAARQLRVRLVFVPLCSMHQVLGG